MKIIPAIIGLTALGAILHAQPSASSSGAPPLYVQVTTDDPAGLDRLERTNDQQQFVEDTLRAAANSMASSAQWTSPITVVARGTQAPKDAAVLRLLLPEGTAEFLPSAQSKPIFLGRVGALPVHSNYPDPYVYRHRVDTAALQDRPVVRQQIEIEKDLYASLQTLKQKLKQDHVGNGAPDPTRSQ